MKLNFNKFTTTVSRINFIKRIITVTAAAREGVKESIRSLPNVNSNGLRVNSQESFLMLDTVVFDEEDVLDFKAADV